MPGFSAGSIVPNVPDWSEDANSPFQADGSAEIGGALASTGHDRYLIVIHQVAGNDGVSGKWTLQLAGDTSSDYNMVFEDGSTTVTASQFDLITGLATDRNAFSGVVEIPVDQTGDGDTLLFGQVIEKFLGGSNRISRGDLQTQSDVTQFTLGFDGSTTLDQGYVEVFHR